MFAPGELRYTSRRMSGSAPVPRNQCIRRRGFIIICVSRGGTSHSRAVLSWYTRAPCLWLWILWDKFECSFFLGKYFTLAFPSKLEIFMTESRFKFLLQTRSSLFNFNHEMKLWYHCLRSLRGFIRGSFCFVTIPYFSIYLFFAIETITNVFSSFYIRRECYESFFHISSLQLCCF